MLRWLLAALVTVFAGLLAVSLVFYVAPVAVPSQVPSVDFILVEKHAHQMQMYSQGVFVRSYDIALGRGGSGAKAKSGDNKVPEGLYRIIGRNPLSAFHLSLRIGYPTAQQQKDAERAGVDPGGDVMIHGLRNGLGWLGSWHRMLDWTRGCIAVTDDEIEQIWKTVPNGTLIEIRP